VKHSHGTPKRATAFRSIDRARAFESVVAQVEASIADGQFPVGARLPSERDLAERFGVSRVVIREAMRYLESRGSVDVRQGSGTFVMRRSAQSVSQDVTLRLELEEASLAELYVVRQSLEMVSARLAAERATDALVNDLEGLVGKMKDITTKGVRTLDDYMRRRAEDETFHLAIAAASGNGLLLRLIGAILPLCSAGHYEILRRAPTLDTYLSVDKLNAINDEHERLALAIKNRDGRAAEMFIAWQMQRSIATWQGAPPASLRPDHASEEPRRTRKEQS
jgi:DNA-binding FadR family transcriptional regulator